MEFPLLYSRSLLIIYFIYSGVYRLIPVCLSSTSPFGNYTFSMFVGLFLFCKKKKNSVLLFFRFHIYVISYDICLSLTLLSMIISRSIHIAVNVIISFFFMAE